MGVQGTSSTVEDTLSFKEPEYVHRVHRVHRTMKYVLFISFSFFSAHMNIQGLDLRFGLPSRDIPPGTAFQKGVFYRPNGRFHRQRTFLERKIRCIQRALQCTLVHSWSTLARVDFCLNLNWVGMPAFLVHLPPLTCYGRLYRLMYSITIPSYIGLISASIEILSRHNTYNMVSQCQCQLPGQIQILGYRKSQVETS